MTSPFPLRLLLALFLSLALALLLLVLLHAGDVAFRVWEHLQTAPWWLAAGYGGGLLALLAGGGWLVARLLLPRRPPADRAPPPPPSEEEVTARLQSAAERGTDVAAAAAELERLQRRRAAGEVHVALFGQVSSGKSSLVRALLPDSGARSDPRAGTTRTVGHYRWRSPAGDTLTLADLPGLHEPDGTLDDLARDEALRAHVVIYLADGDLTRDQYAELQGLLALNKPLILALNKEERYSAEERAALRRRLTERVAGAERVEVVTVSAATTCEVQLLHPDGREEWVERSRPARVEELIAALQRHLDQSPEVLERLRDAAVFTLVARRLDAAVAAERRERAARLVAAQTRKAVIGALAAVSPGSDLAIQGYLGLQLVRGLAEIYEVSPREIELERFLAQATQRAGGLLPLSLAIAGNALKAFPGLGTLGGGLLHAVAYGLLFDGLGRSVAHTLELRGTWAPQPALHDFEEMLGEDLEARARRLVRLALERDGGER